MGRPFFTYKNLRGEGLLLSFTLFFEDPSLVGLFTYSEDNNAKYCRVVFGKEPTDTELFQYFLQNFRRLQFTDSCPAAPEDIVPGNPKRRKREISKQLRQQFGTKQSYETFKLPIKQSKKKTRLAEKRREKPSGKIINFRKKLKKAGENTTAVSYLTA